MSGAIEEAAKKWLTDPTYQKVDKAHRYHLSEGTVDMAHRSYLSEGRYGSQIPLVRR